MKVILACGRNVTADATEHLTALNGTKNVKLSDWIGYTQFLLGQIIASKNHTKKSQYRSFVLVQVIDEVHGRTLHDLVLLFRLWWLRRLGAYPIMRSH